MIELRQIDIHVVHQLAMCRRWARLNFQSRAQDQSQTITIGMNI